MRWNQRPIQCKCGGEPVATVSYSGFHRYYLVICKSCGKVIGSPRNMISAVKNWNNENKLPKDNNLNCYLLDCFTEGDISQTRHAPYLRGRIKDAKNLYSCLVETDNDIFRSKVQELADSYLDDIVRKFSKEGFIF